MYSSTLRFATRVLFLTLILCEAVLIFGIVPARVQSVSMFPAIVGTSDPIWLLPSAYQITIPWLRFPLLRWSSPKRGDLILIELPKEPRIVLTRVIGTSNDHLSFREGELLLNGASVAAPLSSVTADHDPGSSSLLAQAMRLNPDWQFETEILPGASVHHVVTRGKRTGRTRFDERDYFVPEDFIFCLGDNRDQAVDSRDFGYVSPVHILAKVML